MWIGAIVTEGTAHLVGSMGRRFLAPNAADADLNGDRAIVLDQSGNVDLYLVSGADTPRMVGRLQMFGAEPVKVRATGTGYLVGTRSGRVKIFDTNGNQVREE